MTIIKNQKALPNAAPLSPSDYRDLVKRRATSILHISPNNEEWKDNEQLRRKTEELILEKINGRDNLLPIEYLAKGIEMAKAVCRFITPSGVGTGFLIDKGIVITNHHVLEDANSAEISYVEFDYEEHKQAIKVRLKPSDLFITSPFEELDFTIVACETEGIEDIKPIRLLRNPTTITRGEYVNIIQHPNGRKKEIALQDNTVEYVKDKVIHYSTDTMKGSSGSPVFNNDWQLVALHHAGLKEEDILLNEGIRIAAIVSKLMAMAIAGDMGAERIIQTLEDSSPYLGFYDVKGLVDNSISIAEVEIPSYKGNKRFADIGFWNIENFGNSVNDKKIKDVSKVIHDMSMDALGLVEVDKGSLDRLIIALKDQGSTMNYVFLDAQGSHNLAVVYDTSTTEVELRDDINQKYQKLLHSKIDGKLAFPNHREPLFAKCIVKEDGLDIKFLMIVCHLKARRDKNSRKRRKLAAQVLSVIIEDLKRDESFKNLPIVLGGDLNDDADSASLSDIVNSNSFKILTLDDAQSGHISYLEHPCSLIDHIIISNDMKVGNIKNDDAAIVRLDRSIQGFVKDISDHAPLVLRIIYKDISEENEEKIDSTFLPVIRSTDDVSVEYSLLKLRLNRINFENEKAYYDEDKDKLAMINYYRSINFETTDESLLYDQLHHLLLKTHKNILSYGRSKAELYSGVDLRPDGSIQSLYSGSELDAENLIREDYKLEQNRKKLLMNLKDIEKVDEEEIFRILEANYKFSIEHVVPQSWYCGKSPMVGDMHHLFVCEERCNKFRSNIPYYDFPDYTPEVYREKIKPSCGKRGGTIKFEPENGKGEVARAVLYFLLRYTKKIKSKFTSGVNINLLLQWHKGYPVTLHEKHRNQAIFEIQGNRNPLIDFPEYANKVNFTLGI